MKIIMLSLSIVFVSVLNVSVHAEQLLFSSGFEDGVTIRTDNPYDAETKDYQFLWGQDVETGFNWPADILGASQSGLHFVHGDPDEHLKASIEAVQGHNGKDSRTLYTEKKKNGGSNTQIPYEILNLEGGQGARSNLYTRYWLKVGSHSPDDQGIDWRALFEWKSKDYEYPDGHPKEGEITGDGLRLITYIYSDNDGVPYWAIKADNDYSILDEDLNTDKKEDGTLDEATWFAENRQVPVPIDEWFLMEVYWYWDESPNGIVVWKVNGQVIAEHEAPSTRNGKPIDFIMLTQTYGAQDNLYQWVDDIEIWDALPSRYEDATELDAGDKLTSYVAEEQRVQYIISAKAGETVSSVLDELSANADLYVKVGSEASGDSFDCALWEEGTTPETCTVTLDQDADVYISVYGVQATSYQLQTFSINTSLEIISSEVEGINDTSVYVHFDLNQKAQGQIEYGTTTDYGNFTKKETSFNYDSHRQLVANLAPNTLYHYRVHAFDEAGFEVVSDDKTFRTNALLEIQSSNVEVINDISVYIHFNLNQQAQGQVEYGTSANYGSFTKKETSFNYASHRQLITGLNPNQLYHYRVHAFDEEGIEVISDDKTFRINALVYPPNTQFNKIDEVDVQRPITGGSYIDPVFGSKVTRLTDRANDQCATTAGRKINCNAQPYPKIQAWNSDMSILRLGYRLYSADTLEELPITKGENNADTLYTINGSLSEIRWSNVDPSVYYGIRGSRFVKATITGNTISDEVLYDATGEGYQEFYLGQFEGNIDYNDKYVALAARKQGVNYPTVIVFNIQTKTVEARKDLTTIPWEKTRKDGNGNPILDKDGNIIKDHVFDWVSISPTGNHVLVNAVAPISQTQQYDRQLNFVRKLTNRAEHGDIGIDVNGDEVYVQFEFGAKRGIWSYRLKDGAEIQLLPGALGGGSYGGGHVSCRNYKRPGWCYLSTEQAGYKEVFALKLDDGTGTVNRFIQTHQTIINSGTFSSGTVNPDGTKVLYNSNFGGVTDDSYMAYFE